MHSVQHVSAKISTVLTRILKTTRDEPIVEKLWWPKGDPVEDFREVPRLSRRT